MHCPYCYEQPAMRGKPHCVDCGWSDRPIGTDGRCSACRDWAMGRRNVIDDHDTIAGFYVGIVERAQLDAGESTLRVRPNDRFSPRHCDVCDQGTGQCARDYLAMIRAAGQNDPETTAILETIAQVALAA